MKRLFLSLLLLVSLAGLPLAPGCATAPSQRVATVQSLKAIAYTVKAAMRTAAQLHNSGRLSAADWERVATVYDRRYLPAFQLAVQAAQSDLSRPASPELAALAAELASLVATYSR